MAQSVLKFGKQVRHTAAELDAMQRKLLSLDKMGVIGGFLLGLLVGVGFVEGRLISMGVTPELSALAMVAVLAAFTRVGQILGNAACDKLERETSTQ